MNEIEYEFRMFAHNTLGHGLMAGLQLSACILNAAAELVHTITLPPEITELEDDL